MIEVEYLSIAEFAELAEVSKQAIYKQISNANSQIAPYLLKDGKKTLIKVSALKELYKVDFDTLNLSTQKEKSSSTNSTQEEGIKVECTQLREELFNPTNQPLNPNSTTDNQPLSTDYIAFLKAQIVELKAEKTELEQRMSATIKEKDSIIQDQSEQLAELAQKVAQIADKALIATSQQQYLTALEKTGDREEVSAIDEQYIEKPKKTIFQRLFGR